MKPQAKKRELLFPQGFHQRRPYLLLLVRSTQTQGPKQNTQLLFCVCVSTSKEIEKEGETNLNFFRLKKAVCTTAYT